MKLQTRIILGYSAVCLIWGLSWSAIKIGLASFPPLRFASYRFALAALLIAFFLRGNFFTNLKNNKLWAMVSLLTIFAFSLPIALMNYGQTVVSSSLAAAIFSTYPLWVAILSYVLLPEDRLSVSQGIGIVFGFGGVIVLFQPSGSEVTATILGGMFVILVSAFFQALSLVLIRKYAQNLSSLHYNFLAMTLSALILYLISFFVEPPSLTPIALSGILSLTFLGFFATAGTFVVYFWLTKHLAPVILSFTAFITPVLAILLGIFILHEEWTQSMTIGTSAILVGILIALTGGNAVKQLQKKQ